MLKGQQTEEIQLIGEMYACGHFANYVNRMFAKGRTIHKQGLIKVISNVNYIIQSFII